MKSTFKEPEPKDYKKMAPDEMIDHMSPPKYFDDRMRMVSVCVAKFAVQKARQEEREKIKNELISADLMSEKDAQSFMEGLQ